MIVVYIYNLYIKESQIDPAKIICYQIVACKTFLLTTYWNA